MQAQTWRAQAVQVASGLDGRIQALGGADLGGAGLGAHRLIFHHPAVALYRGDIGIDPVVIAVLAAVLHQAHPTVASLEGLPQMGEGDGRHVRVANHVVVVAEQLGAAEAADVDKVLVDVADGAF